ncbi:jg6564 [Pararge aegeria aegeria]|uniref:Jg6564 protein n=1 Tax=Pararge aegeria aegeria TaxID=348720 RepID=A0A8S4S645_9NEOP|nr:jg6564 [Pararge aegeria aegeria]
MLSLAFITLVLSNTVLCQINGEFWWLHEKVAELQNIEPPQPKFEEISELETDESVKVVFQDNALNTGEKKRDKESTDTLSVQSKILPFIVFVDRTKLAKQDISIKNNSIVTNYKDKVKNLANAISWKESSKKNKDEFEFIFPEDIENSWGHKVKNDSKHSNSTNQNDKKQRIPKVILNDKIWFEEERIDTETESICTFVNSNECFLRKGFINSPSSCPKNIPSDACKICCVLPLTSSKPRSPTFHYKRYKRSDPGEILSAALKQRNALLLRKYNTNTQQAKLVSTTLRTKPVQKIVTPNDYVDPYWNVKNQKFRDPNQQSIKNNPNTNDYEDDYAVELPKPGLVGLYSDQEDRVTSWKLKTNKGFSYGGIDDDSDEDDGDGFGYSTIDPRFGNRKNTPKPRRHPQRLMTPSTIDDALGTSESQTIHFHSTPDFHVLEGFKLLNLADNKNRLLRKTTTENFYQYDEELSGENTSPFITNTDLDYTDAFDISQQVFKNCGKGAVEGRCDPWLIIVVLTKDPDNILCYATIVHPRAAVTAASCVHGKSTGDISAIAGVWNLKERSQSQQRMASIHVHPQFSANDLANDLAVLHWKRPLRLQSTVLPACLADPHVGDECYFVGWGGYDQALKQRPQWQQAAIITPRNCNKKVSSPEVDLPANAFCASVETRGTVTGVGGPLLCKGGNRVSVVGVAVYREDVVVLLPTFEWVTNTLREIQIN